MGTKYKATGFVTICKEITVEFEDDGVVCLEDQAHEAIINSDDIPLSMARYVEDVDDLSWKQVE